jgi:hypothetical protein
VRMAVVMGAPSVGHPILLLRGSRGGASGLRRLIAHTGTR